MAENFLPKIDGVTRCLARLLKHLRDEGHEAVVLGPEANMVRRYLGFSILFSAVNHVLTVVLRNPSSNRHSWDSSDALPGSKAQLFATQIPTNNRGVCECAPVILEGLNRDRV